MMIEHLREVDSTNRYIRRYLAGGEDALVTALRQTGGMGTKGRSFLSEEGGVFLSKLTFYRDRPAGTSFLVMTHAAVAVCRTAEEFGVRPEIKWPNDILVRGRKLCGILIENSIAGGMLHASIVGIGLNVANDVSALGGIAVTLCEAAERTLSPESVRDRLIFQLSQEDDMQDYLSYVRFLGKQIDVTLQGERFVAVARRILPDGRLEIERDGVRQLLSAAEIRLMEQTNGGQR